MNSGPICPIPLTRVERRDDSRLPTAWVGAHSAASGLAVSTTHLRHVDQASPVQVDRGTPVLVMLRAEHAPVLAELLAPGSAGERVYVLAPAGWGQPKLNPQLLACPTVLIRRIPEVPTAGVYRASGAQLWMGAAPSGEAPWCLNLDAEQAEAFRQVFLRLFWHHATDEGWTGGKQLSFRPASERPFDVPELPRSAPVRLLGADEALDVDTRGALVHFSDGKPPPGTPRRLWFPIGGSHHGELARLVREGAEVVWDSRALPELVVWKRKGIALLPGTRGRLLVELNPAQAADAGRILESATGWRFQTNLRLGDHASSGALLWLDGASTACPVETEQIIDLPNVESKQVRSTPETSPPSWTPAQPLALTARYKWTALPPRLPAGSEEDPLVGRWRQVDKEWSATLSKVRALLENTDKHRGHLGQVFSRLLGGLLGFEHTNKNLLDELDSLDTQKPSAAGPVDAPGLILRLAQVEERARELQRAQEQEERKAQEQVEREKQERDWKNRVEQANGALPERRKALADSKELLLNLVNELATVEDELKTADKKARKDLQARQARISDDLAKAKRDIKRLEGELVDLEERAAETLTFKPPGKPALRQASGAGRFVPQATPSHHANIMPDEALPEVGMLRRQGGQRYLAIETWEELAHGEQSAARLKARLVVPENV